MAGILFILFPADVIVHNSTRRNQSFLPDKDASNRECQLPTYPKKIYNKKAIKNCTVCDFLQFPAN
jgi:hypothetical protein